MGYEFSYFYIQFEGPKGVYNIFNNDIKITQSIVMKMFFTKYVIWFRMVLNRFKRISFLAPKLPKSQFTTFN